MARQREPTLLERADAFALSFVRLFGVKGGCGTRVHVPQPQQDRLYRPLAPPNAARRTSSFQPNFARRKAVRKIGLHKPGSKPASKPEKTTVDPLKASASDGDGDNCDDRCQLSLFGSSSGAEAKAKSKAELKAEGKPEKIWDKIIPGKLERFVADNTLLDQERCLMSQFFALDDSITVENAIKNLNPEAELIEFKRVAVG